jgi:hypothetical protein
MERRVLGLSQRQAAAAGGTSNQTWSRFEESGKVTDAIYAAVIKAFDWPSDWPENPPAATVGELDELAARMAALVLTFEALLKWLDSQLSELGADMSALPDVAALLKRIAP